MRLLGRGSEKLITLLDMKTQVFNFSTSLAIRLMILLGVCAITSSCEETSAQLSTYLNQFLNLCRWNLAETGIPANRGTAGK